MSERRAVAAADLADLARLSSRLGRDPTHVQAAGGNTSVKTDGTLWVKASGTWLADALRDDIFVGLDLDGVRARIDAEEADPAKPEVVDGGPRNLRPSIETTMHALLPHKVVLHTHSVAAIAVAVREDGEAEAARRLDGLSWGWVPYVTPGLPLTKAIEARLERAPADVLVLGNHGLVVGGDDFAAAEALLDEAERRLAATPRKAPAPDLARLERLAEGRPWRLPKHAEAHATATDPLNLARARAGVLYPDHAIFLGAEVGFLPADADAAPEAADTALLLVEGAGVLVREDLSAGGEELALCLALVLERVPPDARPTAIPTEEVGRLLDWDAEAYRQTLKRAEDRGAAPGPGKGLGPLHP